MVTVWQYNPVRRDVGCDRGRGELRGDAERRGGGGGCAGKETEADTERGAGQQDHLRGGQDPEGSTSHPLKSFPETYRPECKSWHFSNSFWNFCSALYARMVRSPWREDAKWENTGLCSVEAEANNIDSQGGWMWGNPPPPSFFGCMSCQRAHLVLPGGLPGGRGMMPFLEWILHVTLKLLLTPTFTLTTWKWKILFEPIFD